MNKLFFVLTLLLAVNSEALEKVDCYDEKNEWSISYQLDGKTLIDLSFIRNAVVVKHFPGKLESFTSRFLGKTYYETSLGTFAYFDFERRKANVSFEGEFLLQNNPIGLETPVSCIASPLFE